VVKKPLLCPLSKASPGPVQDTKACPMPVQDPHLQIPHHGERTPCSGPVRAQSNYPNFPRIHSLRPAALNAVSTATCLSRSHSHHRRTSRGRAGDSAKQPSALRLEEASFHRPSHAQQHPPNQPPRQPKTSSSFFLLLIHDSFFQHQFDTRCRQSIHPDCQVGRSAREVGVNARRPSSPSIYWFRCVQAPAASDPSRGQRCVGWCTKGPEESPRPLRQQGRTIILTPIDERTSRRVGHLNP